MYVAFADGKTRAILQPLAKGEVAFAHGVLDLVLLAFARATLFPLLTWLAVKVGKVRQGAPAARVSWLRRVFSRRSASAADSAARPSTDFAYAPLSEGRVAGDEQKRTEEEDEEVRCDGTGDLRRAPRRRHAF